MEKNSELSHFRILIVIDNNEYLQILKEHLSAEERYELLNVKSLEEAETFIKEYEHHIHIVIIDTLTKDMDNKSFVVTAQLCLPTAQIYLINTSNEVKNGNNKKLQELGIQAIINSAEEACDIIKVLKENLGSINTNEVIKKTSSDSKNKDADQDYIAIKAQNFLSGKQCLFDVYIKLGKKYVKILSAGDKFVPKKLNEYLDKGLKHLYICKNAHIKYIQYCNELNAKILRNRKISTSIKISQSLNQGEETIKYLQQCGLSKEGIQFAKSYSHNVHTLVTNMAQEEKTIDYFIKNVSAYEHSVGTTILSGLVGKSFGLEQEKSTEIIGLAASFHDIGLFQKRTVYGEEEDTKYLDEFVVEKELVSDSCPLKRQQELKRIYYDHHKVGAEIVSKIPGVKEIVPQIILQHHMRYNNSGFPKREKRAQLIPIAEIIAICDEFNKILRAMHVYKLPSAEMKKFPAIMKGFSAKIRSVFSSTVLNKQ